MARASSSSGGWRTHEVDGSPYRAMATPPADVVRFLRAVGASPGMLCSLWQASDEALVEVYLVIARDCLELRPVGAAAPSLAVPLGYLRAALVATDASAPPLPSGVGEAWADFAVFLTYFDASSADVSSRAECLVLSSDVEAALLCRSITHLQRFGIAPPTAPSGLPARAAAQARKAFAALSSPDIEDAVRRWREGAAWRTSRGGIAKFAVREDPAGHRASRESLAQVLREASQGFWEVFSSPAGHPWRPGTKADPSLACGWDVPQPHMPGGSLDALAAEGELSERWHRFVGGRQPADLSLGELRTVFAYGDRIPWQYRLMLWPVWLSIEEAPEEGADSAEPTVDEACIKQIDKDVHRTRPDGLKEGQREVLGRVLRAYAARRPDIGYCQGMNFVTAVLLLVGFDERQALHGLIALIDRFCDGYYEVSMRGLLRDVAVLDALMSLMLPGIHARLAEIELPLVWIAAEPLLTLFSRGSPLESVCRLWDFFLIEGPCAVFAVFLAYAELADSRNLFKGSEAEDALGAFSLILGDAGALASSLLRRAALFLAPRPFGGGLNMALLEGLRSEVSIAEAAGPP